MPRRSKSPSASARAVRGRPEPHSARRAVRRAGEDPDRARWRAEQGASRGPLDPGRPDRSDCERPPPRAARLAPSPCPCGPPDPPHSRRGQVSPREGPSRPTGRRSLSCAPRGRAALASGLRRRGAAARPQRREPEAPTAAAGETGRSVARPSSRLQRRRPVPEPGRPVARAPPAAGIS